MKRTVLLVDDNRAVTEIIRALLNRNSFAVEVANSPQNAMALLTKHKVDVIVTDVMMPGIDGFELGRQIRANPDTSAVPIIYLTALDSAEDEFEAYLSGADAYMIKPFKARDLLASIENVLSGAARARSNSHGRLASFNEQGRVLAATSDQRLRQRIDQAAQESGLPLEFSDSVDNALKRLNREKFTLLLCDAMLPKYSDQSIHDYMRYFALNLPVIVLRDVPQPSQGPRFADLKRDCSGEAIAAAFRAHLQHGAA